MPLIPRAIGRAAVMVRAAARGIAEQLAERRRASARAGCDLPHYVRLDTASSDTQTIARAIEDLRWALRQQAERIDALEERLRR